MTNSNLTIPDPVRAELEAILKKWRHRSRERFKDAKLEGSDFGRRFIEHGAFVELNCISDIEALIEGRKPSYTLYTNLSEQENIDRDAAKAALHQMIDGLPFTADDLVFITVIVNGFWSVPPAALFQQLRSGCEQDRSIEHHPDHADTQ